VARLSHFKAPQPTVYHGGAIVVAMPVDRSVAQVEAELIALRAAAERAGFALACLFSTSDEFEAAIIRERREAGAYGPQRHQGHTARAITATLVLAAVFLMF